MARFSRGSSSPSSASSSRMVRGFSSLLLSAVVVMLLQAGYSAAVARILTPAAFGAYAAAVALGGLTALIAAAALGQAAARREDSSVDGDRFLFTAAFLVGCVGSVLTLLFAEAWSRFWGVAQDVGVLRVVAVGLPFASLTSVASGIMRREGRTSRLAFLVGVAQVLGLVLGLVVVVWLRQSWTVALALVTGQMIMAVCLCLSMIPRRRSLPGGWRKRDRDVTYFTLRAAPLDVARYLTGSVPLWAIGRFCGPEILGTVNRAWAMITVPLSQVQATFTNALFPELRPGAALSRNARAFTDLMVLVASGAVVVLGVGLFAAGPFLTLILGEGWGAVNTIAILALFAGVLPLVGVPLINVLEANGRFVATSIGWFLGAVAMVAGTLWTVRSGSPTPALVALVLTAALPAVTALVAASRFGLVQWRRCATSLGGVLLAQLIASAAMACLLLLLHPESTAVRLALVVSVAIVETVFLLHWRERIPAYAIARAYRLIPWV